MIKTIYSWNKNTINNKIMKELKKADFLFIYVNKESYQVLKHEFPLLFRFGHKIPYDCKTTEDDDPQIFLKF